MMLVEQREAQGHTFPVVVTTRQFDVVRKVGDPASTARVLASQLADELVVIRRGSMHEIPFQDFGELLQRIALETAMPMTVGGGLRDIGAAHELLRNGADKVLLGPAALSETCLVEEVTERFGRQCVVAAVDFRMTPDGPVAVHGSGRTDVAGPLFPLIASLDQRGIGELLLTDVDRDGSAEGLNVAVAAQVRELTAVPVILSGGCGQASHMLDAFVHAGVDAVAAGTYFASRDQSQFEARALIASAGVAVRTSLV